MLEVREQQGVENCFLRTLPSSARMVGKGAITDPATGTTGSYAYIMSCDPTAPAGPFEVRYGTHRFRLTTVHGVSCADYSNVTTPAAGFDTQTGNGTGTLDGVAGAYFEWTFVDGGLGGLVDSAYLSIRVPNSHAAVPGHRRAAGQVPRLHPAERLQHRPGARRRHRYSSLSNSRVLRADTSTPFAS